MQQTAAVDGTQAEHTFYTSPLEGTVHSLLGLPSVVAVPQHVNL